MIILDISSTKRDHDVPMAWIKGTDSSSRETISMFRQEKHEKKMRVRFCDLPELFESTFVLTADDYCRLWHTKKEIRNIRKDAERTIRKMNKDMMESERFSSRGLEDLLSRRASIERKGRKRAVLYAVLKEQSRQLRQQCTNSFKIQQRSEQASLESRNVALQLARQDADDAASVGQLCRSPDTKSRDDLEQKSPKGLVINHEAKQMVILHEVSQHPRSQRAARSASLKIKNHRQLLVRRGRL